MVSRSAVSSSGRSHLQARGLYTPRARPHETSLLNIIKGPAEIKPKQTKKMLYDTDDVPFECFETHEGEVDVLAVASGRRQLSHLSQKAVATDVEVAIGQRQLADKIELGKGWQHVDEFPGNCDGGYYSHCGRFADQACPMLGHHDSRGAVVGNEFSGWMVLEIPKVEEGLIMIKIYSRVNEASNTITEGWTKVNNGGRQLRSETPPLAVVDGSTYDLSDSDYIDGQPDQRLLSSNTLPDSFRFDYAINGKVTTLDKEEFHDMIRPVQRVVEVLVLLDDKNFGTQENVEVAFRMRGCGRECTMGLTHAYWA